LEKEECTRQNGFATARAGAFKRNRVTRSKGKGSLGEVGGDGNVSKFEAQAGKAQLKSSVKRKKAETKWVEKSAATGLVLLEKKSEWMFKKTPRPGELELKKKLKTHGVA